MQTTHAHQLPGFEQWKKVQTDCSYIADHFEDWSCPGLEHDVYRRTLENERIPNEVYLLGLKERKIAVRPFDRMQSGVPHYNATGPRLHFSICWLQERHRGLGRPRGAEHLTTACSVLWAKGPAKIAKELNRRLLPGIEAAFELAEQDRQQDRDYNELTQATLNRLARLTGGTRSDHNDNKIWITATPGGARLSAQTYGDSVTLEFSVTEDQAAELIHAWKGLGG